MAQVATLKVVEGIADPVENQNISHLRSHLKSQVSFLKSALELTAEQSEKLVSFDAKWLLDLYRTEAVSKKAKNVGGNVFEQFLGGGAAVRQQIEGNESPEVKSAKTKIDKNINELLTAQQQEQLKQERKARDDFHAQSLAELTVVLIERQIHLSDDQAEKSVLALTGKINKSCGWHVYLNNPQYMPTIPKNALSSVLSEDHLRFIRGLNQQDFIGNDFGFAQMFGFAEEAEELRDDPFR